MIQFMPANHSNTNRVITILIHSDKKLFQNVFVTLLRRVATDVTSSLLSWHKRYDFNAANFRRNSQWKCALQTQWIRMYVFNDRKKLIITVFNVYTNAIFMLCLVWLCLNFERTCFVLKKKMHEDPQPQPPPFDYNQSIWNKLFTTHGRIYTQTKVKQHHLFSEKLFWKLQYWICG